MIISGKKTKTMIFNFTNSYQFQTRLKLNNQTIEYEETYRSPCVHIPISCETVILILGHPRE